MRVILFLLAIGLSVSLQAQTYQTTELPTWTYVLQEENSKQLEHLPAGTRVKVTGTHGSWTRIEHKGHPRFIPSSALVDYGEGKAVEANEPVDYTPRQNVIHAGLKARAKAKWPNDYNMQEYEYKNQLDAYNQVMDYAERAKSSEDATLIWGNALLKWSDDVSATSEFIRTGQGGYAEFFSNIDWTMVWYEIKKQTQSYNRLNQN